MISVSNNSTLSLAEHSDAELIVRTRELDDAAYSTLWKRHNAAALSAARSITHRHDPEDMAQEAFVRILNAIRNGAGPEQGFRSYLYATLRTISMAWSEKNQNTVNIDDQANLLSDGSDLSTETADKSLTVTAFAALPAEWRTVLWYTEVEQMTPAEIAPILGMTPGAVAALSFRARNGLRQSWLQAHAAAPNPEASSECKWAHDSFAAYLRDTLSARRTERIQNHLVGCFPCSTAFAELSAVNESLRGLLLPLALGVPATALFKSGVLAVPATSVIPAVPAAAPVSWESIPAWLDSNRPVVTGVSAGAITLGAVGVALALFVPPTTVPQAQVPTSAPSTAPAPSSHPTTPGQTTVATPDPTTEIPSQQPEVDTDTAAEDPAQPAERPTPPTATRHPALRPTQSPNPPPTGLAVSPQPIPTPPSVVGPGTPPPSTTATPKPTPTPVPSTPTPTPPELTPTPPTAPAEVPVTVQSVSHNPQVVPALAGAGTPGATITVLTGGKELASTTVAEDGTWQLTIPAAEIQADVPYTFAVRQVTPNSATEVTNVLSTDGAATFSFVAPKWSHVAASTGVAAGSPNAIQSGGTIQVNGANPGSPNSSIHLYFSGQHGSKMRVVINGAPQNVHNSEGDNLLVRTWTKRWTAQEAGPQVLEIYYEQAASPGGGPMRGPSARFILNVSLK